MKIEELRIGNWVIEPQNEKPKQIEEIRLYENEYCCTFRNFHYGTWLSKLKPVPVTEKLLLKCGFKCVGAEMNGEIVQQFFQSDLKSMCFVINNAGVFLCVSYNNGYARIDTLSQIKNVSYLHQLQNLYFVLTNKELEVQL